MYVFNIPVVFIWLWQAIRSRNLFFFTLTNPGIETGGFFGESKSGILKHIPDEFKPKTILWKTPVKDDEVESLFQQSGLSFPIIIKPEIGERGWLIARINDLNELKNHISLYPVDFILQPFITLPLELGIMVYKMPDGSKAEVTSICKKEFLHVIGDGASTLRELILSSDRAVLQYEKLEGNFGSSFSDILAAGQLLMLEPIGNHCRGTKFLNFNQEIDDQITEVMVRILSSITNVYYGRFDMKVSSWAELRQGKGIQILEFNGTSSDPAHIYDPSYSLIRAYRDLAFHWGVMGQIARQNRKFGFKPEPFKKIISALILYFRYKRTN